MNRGLKINDDQMKTAIRAKEFDKEITASACKVVIIMTQDWCPQWHQMNDYLEELNRESLEIDVYEVVYNKEKYHHDFMNFKEEVFKNDLIPYIRFYIDGKFSAESNYISKKKFLKLLES